MPVCKDTIGSLVKGTLLRGSISARVPLILTPIIGQEVHDDLPSAFACHAGNPVTILVTIFNVTHSGFLIPLPIGTLGWPITKSPWLRGEVRTWNSQMAPKASKKLEQLPAGKLVCSKAYAGNFGTASC